ncbi:hypothetical protein D3C85_1203810 [compost metagenome]
MAGVGQGLPGLGIERRFLKAYQVETPHQRGRAPVVEQHRFATAYGRGDFGIECGARATAKVHVVIVQAVGLELLAVDGLGSPAAGAVEEAALVGGFGVLEHGLVLFEVGHRAQIRRQILDHVRRHIPALIGILHRIADAEHLAGLLGLDPGGAATGPFFADDLDVVAGQGHFHAHGAAGQGVGGVAVAFLDDQPQDLGGEAAAFPGDVTEVDGRGVVGGVAGGYQSQRKESAGQQGSDRLHCASLAG